MSIEELLVYGKQYTHSYQARMLLSDLVGYDILELLNHLQEEVSFDIEMKYKQRMQRVKEQKPLQYIMGNVNFYGNTFLVDERVLIPRFETEELVEKTLYYIEHYFKNRAISVIDLGCGSGVIGLTIKQKRPSASVTLLDISEDALCVAKENAQRLQLEVLFEQGDMLDKNKGYYDVIISNPPYIMEGESIEEIVRQNEPSIALYGGKEGLDYYEQILKQVPSHTNESYLLAFEIGYQQKESIEKLVAKYLKNVTLKIEKDLAGRNRMLFVFHNLE